MFGIIKQVMKLRQFPMRGVRRAGPEWNLVVLAGNFKRMNALNMA